MQSVWPCLCHCILLLDKKRCLLLSPLLRCILKTGDTLSAGRKPYNGLNSHPGINTNLLSVFNGQEALVVYIPNLSTCKKREKLGFHGTQTLILWYRCSGIAGSFPALFQSLKLIYFHIELTLYKTDTIQWDCLFCMARKDCVKAI